MKMIIVLFLLFLITTTVFAQKSGETKTTEKKNIQTNQSSTKNEERVVFIGDSIFDFWDEEKYGGFFPGKPYINRGISGQTTSQIQMRFQQDVIDLKPKAVVILAGTNDIYAGSITLDQTVANIASMTALAKANGIKVIISSVLPVSDSVKNASGGFLINSDSRPPEKILAMNKRLKAYASQKGFIYLDYHGALSDKKGFAKDGTMIDGLHPNANGYAIMNSLTEKAIRLALKTEK